MFARLVTILPALVLARKGPAPHKSSCPEVEIRTGTYEDPSSTKFLVDGEPVKGFKTKSEVNVVIVNAVTGKVRKFSNFGEEDKAQKLVAWMSTMAPSDVILIGVAFCSSPPGTFMSMMRQMGATITPSTGYALIGRPGGKALGEVEGQDEVVKATLPCHEKFSKDFAMDDAVGVKSGGTYDLNTTIFFGDGEIIGKESSRGINVLVLSSEKELVKQKAFDLVANQTKANKELEKFLKTVSEDEIIMLGVHGTGMELTTGDVRKELVKLGASRRTLDKVQAHEGYSFIATGGVSKGEELNWGATSIAQIKEGGAGANHDAEDGEDGEGGEGGAGDKEGDGSKNSAAGAGPSLLLLVGMALGMVPAARGAC